MLNFHIRNLAPDTDVVVVEVYGEEELAKIIVSRDEYKAVKIVVTSERYPAPAGSTVVSEITLGRED